MLWRPLQVALPPLPAPCLLHSKAQHGALTRVLPCRWRCRWQRWRCQVAPPSGPAAWRCTAASTAAAAPATRATTAGPTAATTTGTTADRIVGIRMGTTAGRIQAITTETQTRAAGMEMVRARSGGLPAPPAGCPCCCKGPAPTLQPQSRLGQGARCSADALPLPALCVCAGLQGMATAAAPSACLPSKGLQVGGGCRGAAAARPGGAPASGGGSHSCHAGLGCRWRRRGLWLRQRQGDRCVGGCRCKSGTPCLQRGSLNGNALLVHSRTQQNPHV